MPHSYHTCVTHVALVSVMSHLCRSCLLSKYEAHSSIIRIRSSFKPTTLFQFCGERQDFLIITLLQSTKKANGVILIKMFKLAN